jgi:hypothetical protein
MHKPSHLPSCLRAQQKFNQVGFGDKQERGICIDLSCLLVDVEEQGQQLDQRTPRASLVQMSASLAAANGSPKNQFLPSLQSIYMPGVITASAATSMES